MANEYNSLTLALGAFNGATHVPLGYVDGQYGGITITSAYLVGPSAGTVVGGLLVTCGSVATGGTPAINGTIGAFAGTIVTAAGVVHALTVSDGYVAAGEWIAFDQTSGTVPAGTFIQTAFLNGK